MTRALVLVLAILVGALAPATVSASSHVPPSHSGVHAKLPIRVKAGTSASQPWLEIFETQAEKPGAAPDWSFTGSGLTSAKAGDSVNFMVYYTYASGPSTIAESITNEVFLNGKIVSGPKTYSYNVPNNKNDYYERYGPIKLTQPGTYYYWTTFAVGGQQTSVRNSLIVR